MLPNKIASCDLRLHHLILTRACPILLLTKLLALDDVKEFHHEIRS
jgi:hypothetical protein